jgi:isopenicillin-N epimerase
MSYSSDLAGEFLLRQGVIFLNHGSFGACPRPVFKAYQAWQRDLEGEPVEFLGRRLPGLLAEARTRLAAYVGAAADNLVFVPNATVGVNIVARSLALRPGDEVLATDHEYGACGRAWRFSCERSGAHFVTQRVRLPLERPEQVVEALWEGVTPRTRVIFFSHITSPTALILPVAEICRRARAEGVLTMIDGAHAPGQIELALDALGADFYTANCHKWLCAPKGSGFLYARPEVQSLLTPLVVGWGWESDTPGPSRFQDYFRWGGTDDPSAYLAVPAAVEFQQAHDWPAIRRSCHALASETRARLNALTGLEPICPDSPDWFGQMVSVRLPVGTNAAETSRRLWEEHHIEAPLSRLDGDLFVRISFQAYNSRADADALLGALQALLPLTR